jgi:catechol 2,3-dioxygenase-like lactoylglutathione lyase family enzyme
MAVLYLPRPTSGWTHITLVSPLYAERRGWSRLPLGCFPRCPALTEAIVARPGGWNRIQFEVDDLASKVEALRKSGARFRKDIVTGFGGKQILLDDPAGNPIELFEPPRR